MRRIAVVAVLLTAVGAFWALASGSGSAVSTPTYWVAMDNAFGLTAGADVKVAGVRAGKITGFALDRQAYHALVGISLTQKGFDQFRTDVFCASKPQSLIGEYFLDCQPGSTGQPLKSGAVIPVTQTSSTIAPDLVMNVLRMPYRERLRIILNELGAGVAGNAANLSAALQRAVPALRQTDHVLAILDQQNHVLADLAVKGDAVVTPLAHNHYQVGRFVQTANRTATTTAERRGALAQTFHKLPAFFEQLRPNMVALGQVADTQTPALANLGATSGQLTRLFKALGPFANASRPAFRALGKASVTADQAVKVAAPTVAQLNQFSAQAPEVGKNLAIILRSLDNPANAIETDQRAAAQHTDGRKNYTGLEAFQQFFYDTAQAINIFDSEHNILKVDAFVNPDCAPYADAAKVNKGGAALLHECASNALIGPKTPGLYGQPDISDNGTHIPRAHTSTRSQRAPGAAATAGASGTSGSSGTPAGSGAPASTASGLLGLLTGRQTPSVPAPTVPSVPSVGSPPSASPPAGATGVLNYLLGT